MTAQACMLSQKSAVSAKGLPRGSSVISSQAHDVLASLPFGRPMHFLSWVRVGVEPFLLEDAHVRRAVRFPGEEDAMWPIQLRPVTCTNRVLPTRLLELVADGRLRGPVSGRPVS